MIRRSMFVRTLAVTAAAAAVPLRGRAAGPAALTIGFVPATLFAPVFVAADRGFYRDAGIAADLEPILAGQDALALLATGRFDAIAAGLSAAFYNGVARELDVRFAASTAYQPRRGHPTALMVRTDLYDGGLRSPRELRGKKIGALGGAGATASYYVARILRENGLRLADVELVNLAGPDQAVALARGAVDAVFAAAPLTAVFAERRLARIVASPPVGISATGIFFGPRLLGDKVLAAAFLAASRRGAGAVAGRGYDAPENLATFAAYTKQPVATIRASDRYAFYPNLPIDRNTLLDMQREFIFDGILTYAAPLPESRLIVR